MRCTVATKILGLWRTSCCLPGILGVEEEGAAVAEHMSPQPSLQRLTLPPPRLVVLILCRTGCQPKPWAGIIAGKATSLAAEATIGISRCNQPAAPVATVVMLSIQLYTARKQ